LGKSEVESIVANAEKSLKSAYLSLLEVEKKGTDTQHMQELVARLNFALEYYSETQKLLMTGDYDSAALTAENIIDISQKIKEEALLLKDVAQLEKQIEFRNQLLLSSILSIIIVIIGITSRKYFKYLYYKRIKRLKPVVDKCEP
jgi:hypothetical protein